MELKTVVLALLMLACLLPLGTLGEARQAAGNSTGGQGGLLIIVTFPCLKYDVELLACEGDRVISLLPQGADPHQYQLTPDDVRLLEDADLIISTGHTTFEVKIRELVGEGEIGARLVEIPGIPGLRLLKNPSTGQVNYHMPIYDPGNYRAFMAYLASVLSELRPGAAGEYRAKLSRVLRKLDELLEEAPKLDARAVADLPVVQYAVSWLGVEVSFLVVKEPGVPATPGDLMRIEEAMSRGDVDLVVLSEPVVSSASERLRELASEHGLPILYVPSPLRACSTLDKLSAIVEQARALGRAGQAPGASPPEAILILVTSLLVAGTLTAVAIHARD